VRSTQDSQDFVLPANTRTATVTVAASDAVAGSFAVEVFGSVARSFQVNETTPARNFTLEVSRGVSLEGNVLVSWSVGPACEGQVLPPNGVLAFVPQQRLATFNLRVVDDDVPELDLDCVVRLDNATVTTPNANSAAIPVGRQSIALTVLESDFPYGVFEVGEASRVLTCKCILTKASSLLAYLLCSFSARRHGPYTASDSQVWCIFQRRGCLQHHPGQRQLPCCCG